MFLLQIFGALYSRLVLHEEEFDCVCTLCTDLLEKACLAIGAAKNTEHQQRNVFSANMTNRSLHCLHALHFPLLKKLTK